MAQLQHWSVTCTTCDSPAEYHCNTCGDILCPRCREIHQRSRGTGHHSVVPYSEKVEPEKITAVCYKHAGHECMLWCQKCDTAACTACVTSADHVGHTFVQMAEKVEQQRNIIKEEFNQYCKLLESWEKSLKENQDRIKAYEIDVDQLDEEVTRTADRVCEQTRRIETALHNQLQDMRSSETSSLQTYGQALLNGITEIMTRIEKAENKLRSNDVGVLLHHKTKEVTKPTQTHPPTRLIVYTPGKIVSRSLETMLGTLSLKTEEECHKMQAEESTKATAISQEEGATAAQDATDLPQDSSYIDTSKMSLLHAASVINTLQADDDISTLFASTETGQVWMRTSQKRLQLMDRQGKLLKTVKTEVAVRGITTTQQGDVLYSADNKSILSVNKNGHIESLFLTQCKPWRLCRLDNGDLLVTFHDDGRVIQYSMTGKMIRELDQSLIKHPLGVAQNKINKHIYVCDKSGIYPSDSGKLLAFSMVNTNLEYAYTGPDNRKFTPCDVCADQAGHVIVTDWGNNRIIILDQDGRFLQYMLTKDQGLFKPYSIGIDTDGYAWVGEWMSKGIFGQILGSNVNQVKILKYVN